MRENKGLTLVELLVTIAVLSIVLICAAAFMVTGGRSFAKGSADSAIQKEAQLAVNQIEDMIIDVNGGVDLKVETGKTELILYHAEDAGGTTAYTKQVISWKDDKISYSKWDVVYDAAAGKYVETGAAVSNEQPLAENVTGFEVDLDDVIQETAADGTKVNIVKSVQLTVRYEDGGKASYATSPVITLRNRMMKSPSPTLIFDNTPTETDTLKLYISASDMAAAVPIQDRITEVERGNMYHIFAMIHAGANVNDLVDWSLEEHNTISTISSDGRLNVGLYEPNTYLTVTAKYKSNPAKKAVGVVKVVGGSPKSLDGVAIITKSLEPFAPKYSSAVSATGFTEAELASDLIYKWSVSEPERVESFTDSKDTLDLFVKKEEANYGKTLNIRLTVTSKLTGQSVSDSVIYRIDSEGTAEGDSNMERAKLYPHFQYTVKEWAARQETEYYFCNEYGEKISALDSLKQYIEIEPYNGGFRFGIREGLPADRNYYVKVTTYYYPESGNDWSYERIVFIPAVQIYGRTKSYAADNAYTSYALQYAMSGYYGAGWQNSNPWVYEYEVMELEYDAPEGIELKATFSSSYWVSNVQNVLGTTVGFECSGSKEGVKLKSMTVKISFREQPDIYAYSTILFGQDG